MKFILCTLLLISSCQLHAEQATLTFAVVPQQSASKLAKLWVPILKNINKNTGLKLQFKTAKNIPTFEKKLALGEYDFAYMNPYHFTVFNKTQGYQALLKAKDKRIKGIIVVHKNSPITSLKELNNTTLAFPAPAAFAASILTRSKLSSIGNQYQSRYVSSHDSVYRAVAKGIYPAGGGVIRTFNNVEDSIKKKLRILWTTDGYTPHAIANHPNVTKDTLLKVSNAFINLSHSNEGKKLLSNIKIKGFSTANNHDWDDVRALRIDLLTDLIQ